MLDIDALRLETPGVSHRIHFNNAGCALPPQPVLDAITDYLQEEATSGGYATQFKYQETIEQTYSHASALIGAKPKEIAITENASVSLVKALFSIPFQKGDVILTSDIEYGNNFLNFLLLKEKTGIEIRIVPYDESGNFDLKEFENQIDEKVRLIAITHVPTNSGAVAPIEAIGKIAKAHNILYLVDACQSVGHMPLDVEAIHCDFLSTTSRKYLRGPRGLGFLYIRKEHLSNLTPPYLDMVAAHMQSESAYTLDANAHMFENWEKPYALVMGFSKAMEYAARLGTDKIWARIREVAGYLRTRLSELPGVTVHDFGEVQCGIVSFTKEGIPALDLAASLKAKYINTSVSLPFSTLLDMTKRGLSGVNRASVHYYNTREEIDQMISIIEKISP